MKSPCLLVLLLHMLCCPAVKMRAQTIVHRASLAVREGRSSTACGEYQDITFHREWSIPSTARGAAPACFRPGAAPPVPDTESRQFTPDDKNAVYIEILGQGILYSFNYERELAPSYFLRVGFERVNDQGGLVKIDLTAFPIVIDYLAGNGADHLELGVGVMPVLGAGWGNSNVVGTATIGYRLQPWLGFGLFRLSFTPLFTPHAFRPWAGASIGASF